MSQAVVLDRPGAPDEALGCDDAAVLLSLATAVAGAKSPVERLGALCDFLTRETHADACSCLMAEGRGDGARLISIASTNEMRPTGMIVDREALHPSVRATIAALPLATGVPELGIEILHQPLLRKSDETTDGGREIVGLVAIEGGLAAAFSLVFPPDASESGRVEPLLQHALIIASRAIHAIARERGWTGRQGVNRGLVVEERAVPESRPRRVLFVDDDTLVRRHVARLLARDPNLIVETAGSFADALQSATQSTPELAVLDLNLPDGNGHHLLRMLREHINPELPAVAFTGCGEDDLPASTGASGFDALCIKGGPLNQLLEIIHGLLPSEVSTETE